MSAAERYARVKTLFLGARGLPRGERTRYLAAECGPDAQLEARVRRMLTLDEQDPEFLATPPSAGEPAAALGPGCRFGNFSILRTLGEGGMGVVYEARQDEPSRRVALKLIRAGGFSQRLRSRFRHEIRVLGQLRHPGIAQIYEAGTHDVGGQTVPYFAMELVEGRPLVQCAAGMDLRSRLGLLAQVCDAAHHAHQKGVIHRDLKPGNILVETAPAHDAPDSRTGTILPWQVKILDFGVARVTGADSTAPATAATQPGQLIGTLAYMSPEQAAGDPGALDVRSDIYSIGVIACEVLTGRLPYDIEGRPIPEAVRIIAQHQPIRLGSARRALRGDIETIVAKALEKEPRRRYASAADLAADLRRYLRSEPILARPASTLYQARMFARRNKPLVTAAALVLAAMAGATAVSLRQAHAASLARDRAEGEKIKADASAAAARRQAHRATLAGAAAAIGNADPITARRLLDEEPRDGRDWAWRYWNARLDQSVAVLHSDTRIAAAWIGRDGGAAAYVTSSGILHRGDPWSGTAPEAARLGDARAEVAAFSGDGDRILTTGPDRRSLSLFESATGTLLHREPAVDAPITLLAASDDLSVVIAGLRRRGKPSGDALDLVHAARGVGPWRRDRFVIDSATTGVAVSAAGSHAAFGLGGVHAWDTSAPAPVMLAPPHRAAQEFAVSADGALIAAGGADKTIALWDRAAKARRHTLAGHTGAVTAMAFDGSGSTLASAGTDLTIRLWDTATGQARGVFLGHTAPVAELRFDAGGTLLLSRAADATLRVWRPGSPDETCILRGHASFVYAVVCSGERVYSGAWDGSIRLWDAATGRPRAEGTGGYGYVTALAASPDGSTLVSAHKTALTPDAPLVLWNAATLEPIAVLATARGEVGDVRFSPDGNRVYAAWEQDGVAEFDLASPTPARRVIPTPGSPRSLAISADGTRLACGLGGGAIMIADAPSGATLLTLEGHTAQVRGVAFHPTRPVLASAADDATARLWDLATGESTVLRGHADKVYCAAFSPDGRVLATGSEDTTIVLWDTESGGELTRLRGHDAYVYALDFTPDGRSLVSGSGDTTVRVWDTLPVHVRWRARR